MPPVGLRLFSVGDTGALDTKRMETIDDETTGACIDYIKCQDEAGTPFGVTVDFDTIGENGPALRDTVTVRHRDSMEQERIAIKELAAFLGERIR